MSSAEEQPQKFDEYEKYEFDNDKHMYSGHSGKQRTKTEAALHTNHHDPSGEYT